MRRKRTSLRRVPAFSHPAPVTLGRAIRLQPPASVLCKGETAPKPAFSPFRSLSLPHPVRCYSRGRPQLAASNGPKIRLRRATRNPGRNALVNTDAPRTPRLGALSWVRAKNSANPQRASFTHCGRISPAIARVTPFLFFPRHIPVVATQTVVSLSCKSLYYQCSLLQRLRTEQVAANRPGSMHPAGQRKGRR